MEYASYGNLRKNLPYIVKQTWAFKLNALNSIINGIKTIHQQKLIHRDLHDGNILIDKLAAVSISDLGLCQSVDDFQSRKNNIYGVVPFIAPEVLRGKPYTPASDIYSFSMIMWEFTSGISPFNNRAHVSAVSNNKPTSESHPQAYYTSRLLDFTKQIDKILDQKEKEIFDYEVDQSDEIHKTGLSQIINEISFS